LPNLSSKLYGRADPAKARWIYGSWIDWSGLNRPEQQAMLKDVERMISIRKAHPDVLAAEEISTVPNIASVPVEGAGVPPLPKPYIRWNSKKAVLVAANPGSQAIQIRLNIPAGLLGWNCGKIRVTDLWSGKPAAVYPVSGSANTVVVPVEIGADKTPGGGIGVLLLQPEQQERHP
jgi:hypothetical protein